MSDSGTANWTGRLVQVDAGANQVCGVEPDGSLFCWADVIDVYNADPNPVPEGEFVQVAAGRNYTCGLSSNGSAICWGELPASIPESPSGRFVQLSAGTFECDTRGCTSGGAMACGLAQDGSATCWGVDSPPGTFFALEVGGNTVCGLRHDGRAECWPTPIDGIPGGSFVQLTNGGSVVCGLRADGSVECWSTSAGTTAAEPEGGPMQDISCTTDCRAGSCSPRCCGTSAVGETVCW